MPYTEVSRHFYQHCEQPEAAVDLLKSMMELFTADMVVEWIRSLDETTTT